LGDQGAGAVNENIAERWAAAKNEELMEFIGSGPEKGESESRETPGKAPAGTATANAVEKEEAEEQVFENMSEFADEMVNMADGAGGSVGEKPVEKRKKPVGGGRLGENGGGKNPDEEGPGGDGPPIAKPVPRKKSRFVRSGIGCGQVRQDQRFPRRVAWKNPL